MIVFINYLISPSNTILLVFLNRMRLSSSTSNALNKLLFMVSTHLICVTSSLGLVWLKVNLFSIIKYFNFFLFFIIIIILNTLLISNIFSFIRILILYLLFWLFKKTDTFFIFKVQNTIFICVFQKFFIIFLQNILLFLC